MCFCVKYQYVLLYNLLTLWLQTDMQPDCRSLNIQHRACCDIIRFSLHVGCVSYEFDGFKQKTATPFHLPLNIYDQSAMEDDWSIGIELQTCKWLETNGLSIDLSPTLDGISFLEVRVLRRSSYCCLNISVSCCLSLFSTWFIKDPSISVSFDALKITLKTF